MCQKRRDDSAAISGNDPYSIEQLNKRVDPTIQAMIIGQYNTCRCFGGISAKASPGIIFDVHLIISCTDCKCIWLDFLYNFM